uniref:Protein LNK2 n=1 Tax=Anthurium amnicola TaxID=1678845 RepID=A0A1D1ZJ34_9ARAE
MFDWNDDEEVRGITLGQLNETKDHIVPYPQGSKDDTLFTVDEFHKKRGHEQSSTNLRAAEQRNSESQIDLPGSNFERDSNFNTNEELFAPRFDMDSWPDLPSLNSAFGKGYMERNHLHSMSSKFINSCAASPGVDTVTENLVTGLCDADGVIQNADLSMESCSLPASDLMPLDTEPDIFGNDHADEEGGDFLNCDWTNISDFDDLDRIFRSNNSIFGHEMIGNADEPLCPSTDAISSITLPFSTPVDEQSGRKRKPLEEDKVDKPKKLAKTRKKLVEKNRAKHTQNSSSWPSNMGSIQQFERTKMQAPLKSPHYSHSAAVGQQTECGEPTYMGFFHCASQHLLPAYRYSPHSFPMVPTLSPARPEMKENHPVQPSHTVYPDSPKHTSEVQSKPLAMTPQEKIEKLRRRQQMQAMLAIKQQQQQFGRWRTAAEMSASQTSSQTNKSRGSVVSSGKVEDATKAMTSSEFNMQQEIDEPHPISILIDDSLGEAIFHHLQDAITKLDMDIRLCIRDSLFRLARSAMKRHNASDRSSTNESCRDEAAVLVNEETNIRDRSARLPTETGTNPIDRIVAHLLFHGASEPGTGVKDEIPPSNPGKQYSRT